MAWWDEEVKPITVDRFDRDVLQDSLVMLQDKCYRHYIWPVLQWDVCVVYPKALFELGHHTSDWDLVVERFVKHIAHEKFKVNLIPDPYTQDFYTVVQAYWKMETSLEDIEGEPQPVKHDVIYTQYRSTTDFFRPTEVFYSPRRHGKATWPRFEIPIPRIVMLTPELSVWFKKETYEKL